VKAAVPVAVVLSEFLTTRSVAPMACAGESAVIVVEFTSVTDEAAVPPMVSETPERKFAPVTVTAVPPAANPVVGLTDVNVGDSAGATGVLPPPPELPPPPQPVTAATQIAIRRAMGRIVVLLGKFHFGSSAVRSELE
jgi:hypothetical protein